jgi:hypothetical protein
MKSEIETTIESLRVDGKVNFIEELFGSSWWTVCIHSFQQPQAFTADLEQSISVELLKLPARWQEGSIFIERLKMTLVQISTDHELSQDERTLPIKIDKAKKVVESIDSDPVLALTHLGDLAFTHNVVVGQTPFTLTLSEYIDTSRGLSSFESRFIEAAVLKTSHHNEWHTELNRFIKAYFDRRKKLALRFIDKLFGETIDIQGEVEMQRLAASNHLDLSAGKCSLCLRTCKECSNVCVGLDGHDSYHDCQTDHRCVHQCGLCPGNKCLKQASHSDLHCCEVDNRL